MDKLKLQQKLIIDSRNWKHQICMICKQDITRSDINGLNFECIDKRYVHTTCISKHVTM